MADVEMVDATSEVKSGKSGAGADTAVDGKKRFEVKKVRSSQAYAFGKADGNVVERCRPLGLGHCR